MRSLPCNGDVSVSLRSSVGRTIRIPIHVLARSFSLLPAPIVVRVWGTFRT